MSTEALSDELLGKTKPGDPVLHIVPHATWPTALCGFRVTAFVALTAGRDRCPACLKASVGRRFSRSSPPPGIG
jgi:hypothetical protein